MTKVTNDRPAQAITNFDKASQDLLQTSDNLSQSANRAFSQAGDKVVKAGDDAKNAAAHLLGAGVNAGMATGYAIKGTVWDAGVKGVGHGTAGVATGAAGGLAVAGEETLGWGAWAWQTAGKAFIGVSNWLNGVVGNGRSATVTEIEGKGENRLSQRLFGVAGEQFQMSADGFKAAWNSYGQAVGHALGAGVNVVYVAGYVGLTAVDLAKAAARTGEGVLITAGQGLTVVAAAGVQAAEKGMEGAAGLTALAAEMSVGLGNLMATPKDGDKLKIEYQQQKQVYDAKLTELLNKNPKLKDLPAFKQLQAQTAR